MATLHAVDGLELRVPRGSIYGFLGRNGAGKTTTIRMLAGLAHPTGGEMRVLDLSPQTQRVAMLERTGFMIDRMLLPSMTGNDLVRFNRGFFPRWNDALASKYADALEIPMKPQVPQALDRKPDQALPAAGAGARGGAARAGRADGGAGSGGHRSVAAGAGR